MNLDGTKEFWTCCSRCITTTTISKNANAVLFCVSGPFLGGIWLMSCFVGKMNLQRHLLQNIHLNKYKIFWGGGANVSCCMWKCTNLIQPFITANSKCHVFFRILPPPLLSAGLFLIHECDFVPALISSTVRYPRMPLAMSHFWVSCFFWIFDFSCRRGKGAHCEETVLLNFLAKII